MRVEWVSESAWNPQSLLHAGKLEELTELLQLHLSSALNLVASESVRSRLASVIRPPHPSLQVVFRDDGSISLGEAASTGWLSRKWFSFREWLADLIGPSQRVQRRAAIVVKRLLSSRPLVGYLAIARPYLCIEVMERATRFVDDFQDEFFEALLANEASVFYSELKNSDNFGGGGHRLALPDENRLIRFYCSDVNYEVVSATAVWIRDAEALTKSGEVVHADQMGGDHVYISFEAAEAIGRVIQPVLMSSCLPRRFKEMLLGVALGILRDLEHRKHLASLAAVMRRHLIEPYGYRERNNYLHILKQCFDSQDHVLRAHLGCFKTDLDAALEAAF